MKRRIGLHDIKLNGPIGLYAEERLLGNEFLINISVAFFQDDAKTEDLSQTVDYSQLYVICHKYFQQEARLIETVAHKIMNEITSTFSIAEEVTIHIKKLNPPVKAEIGSSFIELHYQR